MDLATLNPLKWLKRSSIENPSTPLSAIFDLPESYTRPVSVDTALGSTAVWAAVRQISSTIATLPLKVYRHTDAGKDVARNYWAYRLLHDRPNPELSSFVFRELAMAHLLLWGNFFAELERNGRGEVIALWPIHPARVAVKRTEAGRIYQVDTGNGKGVVLAAEQVLHVPGFSLDGCLGLFPVHVARNAIGLGLATEEFGSRYFSNGAQPGGVLSHPGKLSEESAERLRASWAAQHGGLANAHRVALLEEGMQWTATGIPPEASQFLETRQFQLDEIARLFLIPPHLISNLARATFSNIEQQSLDYVTRTIQPWATRIEQELNYRVIGPGAYFAEFDLAGLLRGDSAARSAYYTALFNIGVLSPNEIRELENLNRIDGGDVRFRPLNMERLDAAPVQDLARELVRAEVDRYTRREAKAMENEVTPEFRDKNRQILTTNLSRVLERLGPRTRDAVTFVDAILDATPEERDRLIADLR